MHPDNREGLQELIGQDYTLQWIIGHGGMSTVWLADDNLNDREVAIKVLKPEFSSHEEFLTRFRNEAIAAEGIESENVVATYDYREVDTEAGYTVCFIVMEYVRGESLADLIVREGKLPEHVALDVMEQAAHGLAVIHRMGLVHRDIKPGNLMITQNGQVKITDFGIAKAAAAVPLTRTGMVVGTAQYVSPEQAQGRSVTAASDVYSLGVGGYELLAGERPFTGDSSVSVALAHVNNVPPALSTTISAPARELIEIALRKDPATRFADGNELALAVAAVREGKRPPQPASSAMNRIAEEPSPTASTRQLAAVAQPTTMHPEAQRRQPEGLVASRANQPPRRQTQPAVVPAQKESPAWPWVLLILLLLGAIAAGVWAFVAGPLSGNSGDEPTTTQPPAIVTEWVTSTAEAPTTESTQPSVVETTIRETVTQEPTVAPSSEAPLVTEPLPSVVETSETASAPAQTQAPASETQQQPQSDTQGPAASGNNGNGPGTGNGVGQLGNAGTGADVLAGNLGTAPAPLGGTL